MSRTQNTDLLEADELLARMRAEIGVLSPKLATAAAYLVERPDEIAFTSMRQMAERAGVQPAIMVRLAQRLGKAGYDALREPFRASLKGRTSDFGQQARDLQARVGNRGGGRPLGRLASELIALERENLATTLDALGGDRVAEASRALSAARCLYVAGQRSLLSVASYVHQVASMFRRDVVLLDGVGDAYADMLRHAGPDDTLLIFTFHPYTRGSIRAAQFAHRRGARIVAVSDGADSPLAELTEDMLCVASEGPGLVPSVVSAMAVAQILTNQMLAQGGQEALEALAETEAQLDAFEAYWDDDRDRGKGFHE